MSKKLVMHVYYCDNWNGVYGDLHWDSIAAETVKELNDKWYAMRDNHDCVKYTPLMVGHFEERDY